MKVFIIFLFAISWTSCRVKTDYEQNKTLKYPYTLTGKAIKIVDGDTFDVLIKDSATVRIRLASIDTPEKTQDFYQAAKDALGRFIFGKEVHLTVTGTDRYRRLIAIVLFNGKNLNLCMVQDGYAWQYLAYDTSVVYGMAEAEARKNKLGLWSLANPEAPWDFKKKNKKN